MAIKSNVSLGAQDVGTGDTTLILPESGKRVAITAAGVKNTTAGTIIIDYYSSPDATSASGTKIGESKLSANGEDQPLNIIGRGFSDAEYLIGVADVAGANISITATEYDGGD